MTICQFCRTKSRDDAKFCDNCGKELELAGDAYTVSGGIIDAVTVRSPGAGSVYAPLIRIGEQQRYCLSCETPITDKNRSIKCLKCGKLFCAACEPDFRPEREPGEEPLCLNCFKTTRINKYFNIECLFEKSFYDSNEEPLCKFMINITATGDYHEIIQNPIHVCLVLDISASMAESNKYQLMLNALEQLYKSLKDNKNMYLSIILFSEGVGTLFQNINIYQTNLSFVINSIENSCLKFGCRTDLIEGMNEAIKLCNRTQTVFPECLNRIYLMTDGHAQNKIGAENISLCIKENNFEVHAFGFGTDFDYDLLRLITKDCIGGTVKGIFDLNIIKSAFTRIAETSKNIIGRNTMISFECNPDVVCNHVYTFRPKENDVSQYISIDSSKWSFSNWKNFEKDRIYTLLIETRLPIITKANKTHIGFLMIKSEIQKKKVKEYFPITVDRTYSKENAFKDRSFVKKSFT